ncbi:MAG TPA: hypothetical protein VGG84_00850 [Gemmatimonadaceae bacterium]|jgi:hypothetical protein
MAATTAAQRKARRPKLKLEQMREQALDARDMQDGVELDLVAGKHEEIDLETGEVVVTEVADGETVVVPHPLMLSDERQEALDLFNRDEDLDQEEYTDDAGNKSTRAKRPYTIGGQPAPPGAWRLARAIQGAEDHRRLLAGGGHSNDVQLAWQLITPAQPDPTRAR